MDPLDALDATDPDVARLRAAGCVFAEEEAALLREAAPRAADREPLLRRRMAGEPLEHVLGRVAFAGRELVVAPGVFVPRRRSEFLARLALAACRDRGPRPVLVEACAGVAPIAATVEAALPGTVVHATEIDAAAARCARRNLSPAAAVHEGDLLDPLPAGLPGGVDVIAAVVPYVPDGDLALLPREAREAEPHRALLGGVDGLGVLARLLGQATGVLAPGGVLLAEVHRDQAPAAATQARAVGLRARTHGAPDGRTAVLDARRV